MGLRKELQLQTVGRLEEVGLKVRGHRITGKQETQLALEAPASRNKE